MRIHWNMQPGCQNRLSLLLRVCTCVHSQVSVQQKLSLLRLLLQHERERLQTWARPLAPHALQRSVASAAWQQYAETAWTINPRMALALLDRHALCLMLHCWRLIIRNSLHCPAVGPRAAHLGQLVHCFRLPHLVSGVHKHKAARLVICNRSQIPWRRGAAV